MKKTIHLRIDEELVARLRAWLHRTGRTAFGAQSAELERMIAEGLERREKWTAG
jgi:predicted DNA-binding protein